jgi:type VI secretion system protein ImpI
VTLTLKITASSGTKPGETRHVFTEAGGIIGRAGGNSWVLPHNKVSAKHALISFRNGVFYIQDKSRNGTSVNSPANRLVADRPYALKAGDRIFIEPYEIEVALEDADRSPRQPLVDVFDDDPLQFFDPLVRPASARPEPVVAAADDWLGAHYEPPVVRDDPASPSLPADPGEIPQGYDPLAPDDSAVAPAPPPRPRRPAFDSVPPRPKPRSAPPRDLTPPPPPPVAVVRAAPEVIDPPPVPVARVVVPASNEAPGSGGLIDVLAGAGLHGSAVTPELAASFGQILRVVVSGLMDVLQSRQRIKDEFRMRQTIFRPADNNPLKFSANVEDALHNLLVKRNAAYLAPVEAFADAFEDLRNHQLAMLAGMRVAFESMLAEFDPDRLQQEFDRQLAKVSLPLVPAKMRYWDLYREKRREMVKDPEAAFAHLFGEEFARAYEEQFRTLKAERRARAERPPDPRPPHE